MFGLYDRLFPEDDPKSKKKWRATVGNTLLAVVMIVGLMVSAMLFNLPRVGNLAWASDVDKKVAEAVKPIEQKLAKMETTVNETAQTTKNLLAKLAGDQIDQLVRRRCKSSDPDEISYLSKEIRRYQDDYFANRGETYVAPTCEEVGFKEKAR